jgi:uncharacterized repeat protein (TIGR03803 family)
VFELSKWPDGTWGETILHDFVGNGDGYSLWGPVALDGKGNLYGSTQMGGTYGYGTLFTLQPRLGGKWSESILHSFSNGTDGAGPQQGVSLRFTHTSVRVFGTAPAGGRDGQGVVYEFRAF